MCSATFYLWLCSLDSLLGPRGSEWVAGKASRPLATLTVLLTHHCLSVEEAVCLSPLTGTTWVGQSGCDQPAKGSLSSGVSEPSCLLPAARSRDLQVLSQSLSSFSSPFPLQGLFGHLRKDHKPCHQGLDVTEQFKTLEVTT